MGASCLIQKIYWAVGALNDKRTTVDKNLEAYKAGKTMRNKNITVG